MNTKLIEEYSNNLLKSIPVVKGMNIELTGISDQSITLSAPLNTHINYEGTAFGGSLNTVCILVCYLSVHHILKMNRIPFKSLVIQKSSIEYIHPVEQDFYAQSMFPDPKEIQVFLKILKKKKIARIKLSSYASMNSHSQICAQFKGYFVARI